MRAAECRYPSEAEAFWLERASEGPGISADGWDALSPEVARLSDLFTTERPDGPYPDYFGDARTLCAYALFFLPQGWTRAAAALDQCVRFRNWRPASASPRVLDVGCGPGSCGVSVAHALSELGLAPAELCGIDHSPGALAAFESFGRAMLKPRTAVTARISDARDPSAWPEGNFDLIVAGFVLNELGSDDDGSAVRWITSACGRLNEGGLLLVVEPALRFAAERLLRASDKVASDGRFRRIGPQLDALPSPLLTSGREHWEHESVPWTAPESAQFINRRLHRDLREVRFSYAAFVNGGRVEPAPPGAARIVSDVQTIKGLIRFIVTRKGIEQQVEVPTRGMSKHEIKACASGLRRGGVVRFEAVNSPKVRLSGPSALESIWTP